MLLCWIWSCEFQVRRLSLLDVTQVFPTKSPVATERVWKFADTLAFAKDYLQLYSRRPGRVVKMGKLIRLELFSMRDFDPEYQTSAKRIS
jgi:hypothetical protein